jgi:hypothetical protein
MVMPAIGNDWAIPDMDDKTRAGQEKQQAPGERILGKITKQSSNIDFVNG